MRVVEGSGGDVCRVVEGEGAGRTVAVGGELSVNCKATPIGWTIVEPKQRYST